LNPTKNRVVVEDLLRIRTASDVRVSPDGSRAAFVVRSPALEEFGTASHLWMVELSSGETRPFTCGKPKDHAPRWSPDGNFLAFVRTQDEAAQVHVMGAGGGESRPLTALEPGSIGDLSWSPDGRELAFTWRRAPRFPENRKDPKVALSRRIVESWYKSDGVGYWDGSYAAIYRVDLEGRLSAVAREGRFAEARWSPDGKWLGYVRVLDLTRNEVGVMRPDGTDRRALAKPEGPADSISWSPDGRAMAFVGHDWPEESWGSRNARVWAAPLDGGPARCLTEEFDRTCRDVTMTDLRALGEPGGAPAYSPDGKNIFFLAGDRGSTRLCRTGAGPVSPPGLSVSGFSFDRAGRIGAAVAGSATRPPGVFALDPSTGALRELVDLNREWLGEVELGEPEELALPHAVQGWLLKPPGFDPARKHPLILQIHGGPRTQYGAGFFHEFQLLAAQGYMVLYANPRGSQGYGEEFARSIRGDWGNLDYRDLMAAVDHAIGLGFVDEKRMAVMGGSYGGYMTSWIVGHTDRFRAAISERALNNWVSWCGTADMGEEGPSEALARPWEGAERLWAMSPIAHVKNVRTPLLILHSERDLRCPLEQAEQFYAALKALGRPVEMVLFPEESHDLSRAGRPDRRIERLRHILRFLQTHL
jgi:dipeptidyl aminopeptidase/acylaminoacyl peptidase